MSVAMPEAIEETSVETFTYPKSDTPWTVIVDNDPVNLFNVVAAVLQKELKLSAEVAWNYTTKIHNEGKCVVFSGNKQECEKKAEILKSYKLWARLEKSS